MKPSSLHSRILAGVLSLFALPLAFAGDADKKLSKMDTDGDGQVSRSEHLAAANQKFAEMDSNRDGMLTTAELRSEKGDKDRQEMSADDMIRQIDQNSDGQVTVAEHTAHAESKFAKLDTNQDGSLSKDELKAGHKMKKKDKQQY